MYLINNPSERAYGCTCREYFHTGLPCVHIAWPVNHLGEGHQQLHTQRVHCRCCNIIYAAKVSSFSDDLLKGIKLSPRFEGPLLPVKSMWKAGTKKDDSGENEEEEKDNGNNTGTNSDKSPSDEEDDKKYE